MQLNWTEISLKSKICFNPLFNNISHIIYSWDDIYIKLQKFLVTSYPGFGLILTHSTTTTPLHYYTNIIRINFPSVFVFGGFN